ncbi:MAG: DinB family protein [Pirellulaceae bacterium]
MRLIDSFFPEFDHEMSGTRSVLEVVPDGLLDWKAHESLHTIGWNASHLADTLSWVEVTLKETSFDIAPIDGPAHETPVLDSTAAILASFDANRASAKAFFEAVTDEELQVPWTLLQGGQTLFTTPRIALIKSLFINHMVHHRAFLVAYLRMNDVKCPALYG